MPIPVSVTVKSRLTPRKSPATKTRRGPDSAAGSYRRTRTETAPVGVNRMALSSRLDRIWRNRKGSPTSRSGMSGSDTRERLSPASPARTEKAPRRESRMRCRKNSRTMGESEPVSTLASSSRLSTISTSLSVESRTVLQYSLASFSPSSSMASWVMPRMPFMGVRNSWLMLARNWVLASLAVSARCRAMIASSSACRRHSPMSSSTVSRATARMSRSA